MEGANIQQMYKHFFCLFRQLVKELQVLILDLLSLEGRCTIDLCLTQIKCLLTIKAVKVLNCDQRHILLVMLGLSKGI